MTRNGSLCVRAIQGVLALLLAFSLVPWGSAFGATVLAEGDALSTEQTASEAEEVSAARQDTGVTPEDAVGTVTEGSAGADTAATEQTGTPNKEQASKHNERVVALLEELSDAQSYVSGEILIVFEDGLSLNSQLNGVAEALDNVAQELADERSFDTIGARSVLTADELTELSVIETTQGYGAMAQAKIPSGLSVAEAIVLAEETPGVKYAQPNYRFQLLEDPPSEAEINAALSPLALPNDPLIGATASMQWHLYRTGAVNAWESPYASAPTLDTSVVVAVIDSGANLTHPDLAANLDVANAWDAVPNPGRLLSQSVQQSSGFNGDGYGHGTMVSGFIGQVANNSQDGAGMANNKVKVLPVRVFDNQGITDTATILRGLEKVLGLKQGGLNIKVVNMSFGAYYSSKQANPALGADALRDYCDRLRDAGILLIAAAGNGNELPAHSGIYYYDYPSYPSDYASVVSVTATTYENQRASFSDYNQYKDLAAPGQNLYSTNKDGAVGYGGGTSYAAPIVAGAAGYLFALFPQLTLAQVRDTLYATATDLGTPGRDDYFGNGLLNVEAAVASLSVQFGNLASVRIPSTELGNSIASLNLTGLVSSGRPFTGAAQKPYTLTVQDLPTGISFNQDTWVISGSPTQATAPGVALLSATDASGVTASAELAYGRMGNPLTISFNSLGGSAQSPITVIEGDELGELPTPVWYAHIFAGWWTQASGGEQVNASTVPTTSALYYARWTDETYVISFNANGGTMSAQEESRTLILGSALGALPVPNARTHYTFRGWFTAATGGMQITAQTTVGGTATYFAQWNPVAYTINLNANGGTVSPAFVSRDYGGMVGNLPVPTWVHHTFLGWFTAASGGQQVVVATPVSGPVTYYAHWSVETFRITLNAQGGSVSPGYLTLDYGTALGTPPLPVPTRTNYRFDGWFTAATGGSRITSTTTVQAAATYYAHWTLVAPGSAVILPGTEVASSSVTYALRPLVSPLRTLDAWGGTGIIGAPIALFKYYNGSNQRFVFTRDADGWYTIRQYGTQLVLDVEGASVAAGSRILTYPAHGGVNQKWYFTGNASTGYTIHSALELMPGADSRGLVIDISGGFDVNGAAAILFWSYGGSNQRFALVDPSTGLDLRAQSVTLDPMDIYTISPYYASTGPAQLRLDVAGASQEDGAALIIYRPTGGTNQQFQLIQYNDGYYRIKPGHAMKALDVWGGVSYQGAPVAQFRPTANDNQQWLIVPVAGVSMPPGSFLVTIYDKQSGLVLDVPGSTTVGGTAIALYRPYNASNQQFVLTKVGNVLN